MNGAVRDDILLKLSVPIMFVQVYEVLGSMFSDILV